MVLRALRLGLLELAEGGEPIPPIGFVADVGCLVAGARRDPFVRNVVDVPGWPAGLAERYDDFVLGKLDTDPSAVRASEALARYKGRDHDRGLVFVIDQFRRRAGFDGILLNPAVIKSALNTPPDDLLAAGWASFAAGGLLPLLPALYTGLVAAVRDCFEVLGPEDVFELEHGTALSAFSQRIALRHVLQAAAGFESTAPRERRTGAVARRDVVTSIRADDTYPVGGYSSISTRGALENMLQSELAYMDERERPDLFDVKYVRDELLYYSRDENRFVRHRRTLVIVLYPDLTLARVKDISLPRQRLVLLLGLVVALVRRLIAWLTDESLVFEILFARDGNAEPLKPERDLIEIALRESIVNGTVVLGVVTLNDVAARCSTIASTSACDALTVSTSDRALAAEGVAIARLRLDAAQPALAIADEWVDFGDPDGSLGGWPAVLERLLAVWS